MVGFMVRPCLQVSPSGFIFCGRTVASCPPTSRPNAQIKQRDVREDVFSQVRWQMYAAREAGVPTVAYRLPAVTQEDGEMEGRDRVRGREGRGGANGGSGDDARTPTPRRPFPPSPSLLPFLPRPPSSHLSL